MQMEIDTYVFTYSSYKFIQFLMNFFKKLDDIYNGCYLFLKVNNFHVFPYIFLLHFFTNIWISLILDNLRFHQYG